MMDAIVFTDSVICIPYIYSLVSLMYKTSFFQRDVSEMSLVNVI